MFQTDSPREGRQRLVQGAQMDILNTDWQRQMSQRGLLRAEVDTIWGASQASQLKRKAIAQEYTDHREPSKRLKRSNAMIMGGLSGNWRSKVNQGKSFCINVSESVAKMFAKCQWVE